MLRQLKEDGIVECDGFLLLTADYKEIIKRNMTRSHILEGIWLDKNTINSQRKVLEIFTKNIIGKFSDNEIITKIIDTTFLTQEETLLYFLNFANSIKTNKKRKGL